MGIPQPFGADWPLALLDGLDAVTFVRSRDHSAMFYVSPACESLTGLSRETLMTNPTAWVDLVHPDDRPLLEERRRADDAADGSPRLTVRLIRGDGSVRWVRSHTFTVPSPHPGTDLVAGVVTDITDLKEAHEAFLTERDFAEHLIRTADVIILLLDPSGRIQQFNAYMEELSGYRLDEVQGRDWFTTFLPERDRDASRRLFRKTFEGAPVRGHLSPIVTRHGVERAVEWSIRTIKDAAGRAKRVLSVGRDVTDHFAALRELRRAKAELEERVAERTAKLRAANRKLRREIQEHREVEERYRMLFETLPHPAYVWRISGDDFELVAINRAADAYTRGAGRKLIGVRASRFFDVSAPYWRLLQDCRKTRKAVTREMEYPFMSLPTTRFLRISAAYAPHDLIHVHTEDLTEARRIRDELTDRERRLRMVTNNLPARIAYIDRDHRLRFVNAAYEDLLGLTPERITGKHVASVFPADLLASVQSRIDAALAGTEQSFEGETRAADGNLRFFEARYVPDFGLDGSVRGCYALDVDITERRRAQQARKASDARYSMLFEQLPDGVVVLDPASGAILDFNQQACALLGHSAEELAGMPVDVFDPDGNIGAARKRVTESTDPSRGCNFDTRLVRGDGIPRDFRISMRAVTVGRPQVLQCVLRDVTEDQRRARQLSRSLAEKDVLLKEVHHRVKNNLQIVSSLLYLQSASGNEEMQPVLEKSRARIRALSLVHETLCHTADLAHVPLQEYFESLRAVLGDAQPGQFRRVVLTADVTVAPVDVQVAIPCGLIVNELVSNALKHAFPDATSGHVLIRMTEQNGEYRLVVEDNGVGAPAGLMDHENRLGLRIVRTLVHQLDGSVTAEPADPGTRITITFPVTATASSPSADL